MLAWVLAIIVCLSICLSHAGVVSKQLNVGSRKQCHVLAQELYFFNLNSRWWVTHHSPEIWCSKWPTPSENADFDIGMVVHVQVHHSFI